MSHQPSTTDKIKSTLSSAYASTAISFNSITSDKSNDPKQDKQNFRKDVHGNVVRKGDFKDKLNDAALGKPAKEETYIEKGVGKLQQSVYQQGNPGKETKPPGLPRRPDHDVQVEEFLRTQYHSDTGDDMPDPDRRSDCDSI